MYKKNEIANIAILAKYEALKKRLEETEKADKETEELDDLMILDHFKHSGHRRDMPAVSPRPVSIPKPKSALHKCDLCNYQTIDETRLNKHKESKHLNLNICDICTTDFKSPPELRNHLKHAHSKVNGSMLQCTDCNFSALNQRHLTKHRDLHHKDLKCTKCDYKTKAEVHLKEHMSLMHRKNFTCKFWARGNCQNAHCQYKHELILCKFGNKCRRQSSCHFQHQDASNPDSPTQFQAPWSNPAFSNQGSYNQEFPFLGQCQRNCCRRGIGC